MFLHNMECDSFLSLNLKKVQSIEILVILAQNQ